MHIRCYRSYYKVTYSNTML